MTRILSRDVVLSSSLRRLCAKRLREARASYDTEKNEQFLSPTFGRARVGFLYWKAAQKHIALKASPEIGFSSAVTEYLMLRSLLSSYGREDR